MPLLSDYIRSLDPGLYWPLTDGAGTVARDWSKNGRNGTYMNGPTLGLPAVVPGLDGRAARFNGSNQYVVRSADSAFNVGTGDFAVCAWFDSLQASGTGGALFNRDSGASGNGIMITVQNSVLPLSVRVAGTHLLYWLTGSGTPTGRPLANSGPHSILVTRRAGVVFVALDGGVVLRGAAAGSVQTNAGIQVGRDDNPQWFNGRVQHVAFFTKALSPQEGAEMHRLGMGQGILTRHRGR